MLLTPGDWQGRGSWRPVGETAPVSFTALIHVREDEQGFLVEGTLESPGSADIAVNAWLAPDEFGTWAVTVQAAGINVDGVAKLESVPHLGLLWSDDGLIHVTFAIFTLRDTHGIRGFAKSRRGAITWELALEPRQRVVAGGNVVSIDARRRRGG